MDINEKRKKYAIKKIISNEFLKNLLKDLPPSPKPWGVNNDKISVVDLNKIKKNAPWNLENAY